MLNNLKAAGDMVTLTKILLQKYARMPEELETVFLMNTNNASLIKKKTIN